MAINLPDLDWDDIFLNPGKYIDQFRAQEQAMRTEAYKCAKLRRYVEGLRDKKDELTLWKTHGIPDPPNRQHRVSTPDDEDDQEEDQGPRRIRVLQLLSGEPTRGWKARDIATALGITNVKSVRTSLDEFAIKEGIIMKNNQAEYFFGPQSREYLTRMSN